MGIYFIACILIILGIIFISLGKGSAAEENRIKKLFSDEKNTQKVEGFLEIIHLDKTRYLSECEAKITFMKTNGKKFSSFESDFKFLWKWNGKGRVPITITYDKKNPSNYSIKELKQIQSSQNSKLVLPFIGILWIVLAIFIITSEIRLSFAENTKYYPYQNQKYHFEVDLPTRIPEFGLEATSEEGVALTAYHDSINIAIYGYGIPDFTALKKEYQKQIREKEKTLGYYILRKDFFIVSYQEKNKIIYSKYLLSKSERTSVALLFEYSSEHKDLMDSIITDMTNSFHFYRETRRK